MGVVLMTPFQRALIVLGAVALALLALLGRYEVVMAGRTDGIPPGYLLDRWTGEVEFLVAATRRPTVPPQPPQ
jgi:hypothetical protein